MSTTYFIAPYNPEEWSNPKLKNERTESDLIILGTDYTNKMLLQWPKVHIYSIVYGIVEWSIPNQNELLDPLIGHLQHNRQVVAFQPNESILFYNYILWHRMVISPKYRLFFLVTLDGIA